MASREELAAALVEAATEVLGEVPEGISEEWDLREDLGADSLDLLEIVMVLEEDFDFTAEEDDFAEVTTVGDALTVLGRLVPG
jgi:acyl carrier protein